MRSIVLDGQKIEYEVRYISKRNVNVRLKPDNSLMVSSPRWVSKAEIEKTLYGMSSWILSQLEKQKRIKENSKINTFEDGNKMWLMGYEYNLNYKPDTKNKISIFENQITVSTKKVEDLEYSQNVLKKWVRNLAQEEFIDVLDFYKNKMSAKYSIPEYNLQIREMKTRWGVCTPAKNKVTLNLNLIYAPRECIEYIALHELTHFLEIHHNIHFYTLVEEFMPDYKQRKRLLNKEFSQFS